MKLSIKLIISLLIYLFLTFNAHSKGQDDGNIETIWGKNDDGSFPSIFQNIIFLPIDFDYSIESNNQHLRYSLSFVDQNIYKDKNNLLIERNYFKNELKNILNLFDFVIKNYIETVDQNKKEILNLELFTLVSRIHTKNFVVNDCFFENNDNLCIEIRSIIRKIEYELLKLTKLTKTFANLNKIPTQNYIEKILLRSNKKTLEVLTNQDNFKEVNYRTNFFSIPAKRILTELKSSDNKFLINWGEYYALMIGNDDYQDEMLVDLDSPINDIALLSDTLISKYRFKKENIKILKNATRLDILDTLFEYRELDKYNNNKNLLIYYAGHGEIDRIDENTIQGYWLPSDAHYQKKSSWISNNTIREELKALPFKHIIIIADSCFSGTLTSFKSSIKEIPINIEARKKFLENKNKLYTRVALTSGNIDEVPDTIDNNVNSQFSIALNNALLRNDDILLSSKLHDDIISEIQYSGYLQDPTYGGIVNAKHSPGGHFIFSPSD